MINSFMKTNRLGLSLIFTIIFFILINAIFNIRFEENDDIIMALISSGEYSGTPDHHLVFINIIYGKLLNTLYLLFPQLEWYTILQVVFNIISVSIISQFILRRNITKFNKRIFIVFLYSIFISIMITLQFTYTAGIMAISGLCLLYENKSNSYLITGACLLVFSSLIRFQASILVLLISLPIILLSISKFKDIINNKSLRFIGLSIFLIGIGRWIDVNAYQVDQDWKYYKTFNEIRGQINDNPNAYSIKNDLPEGLTIGDYNLLLTAFANEKQINLETITEIKSQLKDVSLSHKILNIRKLLKPYYLVWLLFTCILTVLFIVQKRSKQYLVPFLMFSILFAGLSFISLEATVKNRVFLISIGVILLLIPLVLSKLSINLKKQKLIGGIILILAIFLNFRTFYRYNGTEFPDHYSQQYHLLSKYLENENKKISPYGTSLMMEYVNPFKISKDYYEQQIYLRGWLSHVPFNKKNLESFDFFMKGNGLYVTKVAYQSVVDIIISNMKANYGLVMKPNIVLESDKDYIVEFVKE